MRFWNFISVRKKIIPSKSDSPWSSNIWGLVFYISLFFLYISLTILKNETGGIAVLVLSNKFPSKHLTNLNRDKERRDFFKYPENAMNISAKFNSH